MSIVSHAIAEAMHVRAIGVPRGTDERGEAGLTAWTGPVMVSRNRAEAPAAFECPRPPAREMGKARTIPLGTIVDVHDHADIDRRRMTAAKLDAVARAFRMRERHSPSCSRPWRSTLLLAVLVSSSLAGGITGARPAGRPPIAGDYICRSGCRLTDAPPSIEIDGRIAYCHSELGGIYTGKLLTERSVYCFNMVGILSGDGGLILWSNGNIWARR